MTPKPTPSDHITAPELKCIADSDMGARYAALLKVHEECCEELQSLSAQLNDLKRAYQAQVEQRERDRQQILRYASGLISTDRSCLLSSDRPGLHSSRIIRITGSPKILTLYLRVIKMPGVGHILRSLRRVVLKILAQRR